MPSESKSAASPSPAYSPGLEGVIAGESAICQVDPNAGLSYRGYDVHDLAKGHSFEQVAWLLLRGELPDAAELRDFSRDLERAESLPEPVEGMLRLMPAGAAPIDSLRTGVSMLASFDPQLNDQLTQASLNKATRILSRMPTLMTSGWRLSRGLEPARPLPGESLAARLLHGLDGAAPEAWQAAAMNQVLILYAEHDFNASTFAARVTASTLSDMYAAITSAIGALKGPLHGGANEQAMELLRAVGSPDNADKYVREQLARKQKLMGFGHRVYRTGDSRVPLMRDLARSLGARLGQEQWADIGEALERAMTREKGLCANVDLYAAPVLHMLGLSPHLNTPLFACARGAGWCAHVIEQHGHNRLIRPRSLYTGPTQRAVPK